MKAKIPFILAAILTSAGAFADNGVAQGSEGQSVAPALITTGSCAGNRLSYATNDAIGNSTTSTTFVDVPGMASVITIPGFAKTCITINYSATVFTAADELMNVRATVDGIPCQPTSVQFDGDSDEDNDGRWARAHAFNFACTNVFPGAHVVKMQYKSFTGTNVFTHWSSMIIHHK